MKTVSVKDKIWEKVLALLTPRKKEFIEAYLKCNRKIPAAARELNMAVASAYKYLRTDNMIKLALEINDMGEEAFMEVEMPTYEWILYELMKSHNSDQKELDSLSADYSDSANKRKDKLKERIEKRFKQITELKNKTDEVIDEESFKLRSLGKDQLIEFGKSLQKEIDDFVQKKAWHEDREKLNEIKKWKELNRQGRGSKTLNQTA